MQLIFDTDRAADINSNMSTLEETLEENFINDAIMNNLKHVSNGNKENIQKQDIIFRNEKNTVNNNKLEEEDLIGPAIVIDTKNVEEAESVDGDVQKNPEEIIQVEQPDTTKYQDVCDNINNEKNINEDDECDEEIVSTSCENEKISKSHEIEQEVDDIIAQQIHNLPRDAEIQVVKEQNCIVEQSNNDNIKDLKENLIQSIETGQILEDYISAEKMPEENLITADNTSSSNDDSMVNDEASEHKLSEDRDIIEEVTENVKETERILNNVDTASKYSENEDDIQDIVCMQTLARQDVNQDSVDKITSEAMSVDEGCKEIDITSDKEDNEITVLDSPINVDIHKKNDETNSSNTAMDCDVVPEIVEKEPPQDATFIASKDEVMIIDNVKDNSEKIAEAKLEIPQNQIEREPEKIPLKSSPAICRLSNSLNILSDDEDELPKTEPPVEQIPDKQCINLEEDDDIMLIDEDADSKDSKSEKIETNKKDSKESESVPKQNEGDTDLETGEKTCSNSAVELPVSSIQETTSSEIKPSVESNEKQQVIEETSEKEVMETPLLPDNFLKSSKKNIADMTREELEEFCILKIVESIVDRSNLSDIKTKLKAMAQNLEDYKKKAMMLTKQNRDLEIVLKSIQLEQKKTNGAMVTPLKITRSVGMQVYMTDKLNSKKPASPATQPPPTVIGRTRSSSNIQPKPNKLQSNPTIPVPRLIPANNAAIKSPAPQNGTATLIKPQSNIVALVNGVRNPPSVQKHPEKRPISKSQSVTVDLTDDEPPSKISSRGPTPPVRLVPSQNLLAPQRAQFSQAMNSPRKVYIPISGPQGQQIKPGQTIMVKTSPNGPRPRSIAPNIARLSSNQVRMNKVGQASRHPAALPDVVKQYQPPNWKALPPAPDLKLSKVENGIVISWKIEGYQDDSYEEIASYQLYAYQETNSPPSTALWKKIGDVKALPLPMACTLTQFMAGFKYYFAVRAVDVKSRVGPFSLPGSILLLNKNV